jgi:HTH-type transcriptional regulator / antitoxin HigA
MKNVLELENSWSVLAPILTIQNEQDYVQSIEQLNALVDDIGTNEQHRLYSLLDTLGILIQAYEEDRVKIPDVSGVEVLKYLMEEHTLTQSDLSEIGTQEVVSEILSEQRELNLGQIKALSQRFHVSPAIFI